MGATAGRGQLDVRSDVILETNSLHLYAPHQVDCGIKILADKATQSMMQTDLDYDKAALSMPETAQVSATSEIKKCRSRTHLL